MIHPHVTVLADRQLNRREILAQATASTAGAARPADLRQIARRLQHDLRAHRRPAITDANALDV
jgi:hypothetical protein